MDRELKRGTLEMVLLKLLAEREMYGYEITTAVEERTRGQVGIKEGTLYPVLYRLEEGGLVEPRWQTKERGVPRKYYSVTKAGRKELEKLSAEWLAFSSALSALILSDGAQ